jgi:hypothetical protein
MFPRSNIRSFQKLKIVWRNGEIEKIKGCDSRRRTGRKHREDRVRKELEINDEFGRYSHEEVKARGVEGSQSCHR